jgi:virginiamycin B lyase
MRSKLFVLVTAFALAACSRSGTQTADSKVAPNTKAAAAQSVLSGAVLTTDGKPAAGLFVTARNTANSIETTVYTRADGTFAFDKLAPSLYDVRVHHAVYEPATTQADLSTGPKQVDLRATRARDPLARASSAVWFAALPDGDMKREFILNCATCHEIGQSRIYKDGKLRDAASWADGIKMMKALDAYAVIPPDFDTDRYAKWLATALSSERIAALKPPATADLAGEQVVITEYPVPQANELPHDLVIGPDRRVWVTAFWNSQMWAMDPATGAFDIYQVNNEPNVIAQVRALEFDRQGMLWMVNGGTSSVVRLDPRTRKYDTFKVDMYAHDLVIDSVGDIWVNDYFSKPERMARLSAKDGKVTVVSLPSANLPTSEGKPLPYGLQVDAADRLWSSQLAANTLALHDIKTGKQKLYKMPDSNAGPRRMAIGLDGKVWIPEFNTGRLTSFHPTMEKFETFDTGDSANGIYDVAVDPRSGDVWLGAALSTELIRFDVKTKRFTRYPLPTEPAYMRHLAIDPQTGDVWSAYSSLPTAVPKVVRLQRIAAVAP